MKYQFMRILGLLVFLLIPAHDPLFAQSALRWSTPRQIPGISDEADSPILVADHNRTVHAFVSQWILEGGHNELAVFYTQWSSERGWTVPIDILLSPNKRQANVLGAFLDIKGMMHVAFFGGIAEGAEIYYSRAPAANAGQANTWLKPVMIGKNAGSLASGSLVGDGQGNLYVIYAGNGEGNGLYEVHSTDWGNTWSAPTTVFLTNSDTLWVYAVRTSLDSKGQLHTVWTVVNKAGNGDAIYYARLDSSQFRWSVPVIIQTRRECSYEADWASVFPYQEQVFLMYNCGSPATRWFRRSSDGGKTWTTPTQPFSLIGENGAPVMLVDGNNTLHIIFANRTVDSRLHGLWHSQWKDGAWSEPEPIVSGPRSPEFDPSRPQAVISQGNLLLVAWRNDPGPEMIPRIRFAYTRLEAPESPIMPLPTSLPSLTPISTLTSEPTRVIPFVTRIVSPTIDLSNPATQTPVLAGDPMLGLLVSIVPVIIVFFVLGIIQSRRRAGG